MSLTAVERLSQDENRLECPRSVTKEMITKIHDTVINVRRFKLSEIASAIGIQNKEICNIITHKLS